MSKSRGNVVAPDEFVNTLGADVVRLYLMFLGPWNQGGPWSTSGINGAGRWVNRLWDIALRDSAELTEGDPVSTRNFQRATHKTIRKVLDDLDGFRFNTAIAAMMELSNVMNNVWEEKSVDPLSWNHAVDAVLVLLAPMAPHITEELWERRGRPYSIHSETLPDWDPELARDEEVTLVVQVNGRVRDKITVPANITEDDAKRVAVESERVQQYLSGKEPRQIIYVPGRLVNVVG